MVAILTQPPPKPVPGWIACTYRTYKGKRFGPYYVRRWKFGRKLHKQYIKAEDLEYYRAACEASRDRRKEGQSIRRWLTNSMANLRYLEKMCRWEDENRLRQVDRNYCQRIKEEGYDIVGRPPTRRKITRQRAIVDGKDVVIQTVFELDGTTKTFVVPFVANMLNDPFEQIRKLMLDAWESVHGTKRRTNTTPNESGTLNT